MEGEQSSFTSAQDVAPTEDGLQSEMSAISASENVILSAEAHRKATTMCQSCDDSAQKESKTKAGLVVPCDDEALDERTVPWSKLPSDILSTIRNKLTDKGEIDSDSGRQESEKLCFWNFADARGCRLNPSNFLDDGVCPHAVFRCSRPTDVIVRDDNLEMLAAVLSNNPSLRVVCSKDQDDSAILCSFLSYEELLLNLKFEKIDSLFVNLLLRLPNLVSAEFSSVSFNSLTLEFLRNKDYLEKLTICDCSWNSFRFFRELCNIESMKSLSLCLKASNTRYLSGLKGLKADICLEIFGSAPTKDLLALENLSTLKHLYLNRCNLNQLGFPLNKLFFLEDLTLDFETLDDYDIDSLLGISGQLQGLNIRLCNADMPIINALFNSNLPVCRLVLNTTVFSLSLPFNECPSLTSLYITATMDIDADFFSVLECFPNLKHLGLNGILYSIEGIDNLGRFCQCLESLAIGPCFMTPNHISAIARLVSLETLALKHCVFESVSPIGDIPFLKHLILDRCPGLEEKMRDFLQEDFIHRLKTLRINLSEGSLFDQQYDNLIQEFTHAAPGLHVQIQKQDP